MSDTTQTGGMLGARVDLTAVDTSTPRPWTRGAHRILRPSVKAIWFSPRGVGKSLAALLLAVQVIEEGGEVVYVDLENGARRQAERLNAILADRDPEVCAAVARRLDYRPYARITPLRNTQTRDTWTSTFASSDLVIIDSTARVLGQLGLDENSGADFSRFMVGHIDPIAEQGAAVLQLDNTGHDEQTRTRGSSTKLDLTELAYKVSSDPIAPDRHGTIRLERVRTRDGDEAVSLEVGAGDGRYGRLQPTLPDEQTRELENLLATHVAEHPGQRVEEIAKAIARRKDSCRSGLDSLERAGTVITRRSERPDRRGRLRSYTGWYPASQSQMSTVPDHGTMTDCEAHSPTHGPTVPAFKAGPGLRAGPNDPLIAAVGELAQLPEHEAETRWQELERSR